MKNHIQKEQLSRHKQKKVAIISENCAEFIMAILDAWKSGSAVVPINPSLPTRKLKEILENIQCETVIYGFDKYGKELAAENSPSRLKKTAAGSGEKIKIDIPNIKSLFDRPSSIILTSGSSGTPNIILHTFKNHFYSALGSNTNIRFSKEDTWLLTLPLYHISGFSIIFRCKTGGGMLATGNPDYSIIENIKAFGATHISLVPSQLYKLLENSGNKKILRKLKAVMVGGAFIPNDLVDECTGNKIPIFKSYGSTEMASQITTTSPNDLRDPVNKNHLKTSGKILRYRKIKISLDGEIMVRGKTLFSGYVRDSNIYLPLDEEEWFHTGDLGFLDDDKYLTVTGRKDTMFICRGENIYPEEIEKAIKSFGGICEAVVVGVDNKISGKVPVAFIKNPNKTKTDVTELKKYLEDNLEKFKIPKFFIKWPSSGNNMIKPDRKRFESIAQEFYFKFR